MGKAPILFFVGCFALAGCGKPAATEEAKAPESVQTIEMAVAKHQPIRELLAVDGSFVIAAGDYAKVSPLMAGKLVNVLVKEGDIVTKDQVVATVSTTVQSAQLNSAVSGANAAKAQADETQQLFSAAKSDYASSVKTARLSLESAVAERDSNVAQAKVDLEKLKAGSRPQEIAQAVQAVRQANVNLVRAKATAERDKKLLAEGIVSGQQSEASDAALELAESSLQQSKQQLELTRLGARVEDVKAAELRLKAAKDLGEKKVLAAQAAFDQAKQGKLALGAKAKDVEVSKLSASQKGADAAAASALAGFGAIRAPFDGVVTKRLLGAGSSVDTTTVVLEIAKRTAKIEFAGQVTPVNAVRLKEGMKVVIGDSEGATGALTSVGVADSQTGQVPIRVVFDQLPAKTAAGQFARIQVILRTISDAVTVPELSVLTREDKSIVFVVANGVAKQRDVVVGPTDRGTVAIEKGLKDGEKVVILGQHELSDGAKVEETKPDEPKPAESKPEGKKDGDDK